jgi:VRR-NUC domain
MTERKIQDDFAAWLRGNQVPFIRHRMDKKSGIQKGWPDFTVLWMSRAVCIEVKTDKGRVSLDQARVIAFIKRSGNKVEICRSVDECIEAVKNILCEGKLGDEATPINEQPRFTKEFEAMKAEVAKVPGNGKHSVMRPEDRFKIGNWKGDDYVFAASQDGQYCMIRKATPADVINFQKLVT